MSVWFERDFFDVLRKERGVSWGQTLTLYDEIGSTNDEALAAVASPAQSGSIFLARSQTNGRGRRGNVWHGAPGDSLLLSCLLRYRGDVNRFMGLSLVVGLAVRKAVAERLVQLGPGDQPQIKWPNDVFADGKKLAGILVETRSGPSGELGTVIGVGLNVGMESFPDELQATSLRLLGASEAACRLEIVLADLLRSLEGQLELFVKSGLGPFLPDLSRADYLKGRHVRVGKVEGVASGIDEEGKLLIVGRRGVVPVMSGTVELF